MGALKRACVSPTLSVVVGESDARELASLPVDELALWMLRAMVASRQATFQRSNSGQTAESLEGTPFVDAAVRHC